VPALIETLRSLAVSEGLFLLRDFALAPDVFSGDYLETDLASFPAERDWDFPDRSIPDCSGMTALRGARPCVDQLATSSQFARIWHGTWMGSTPIVR